MCPGALSNDAGKSNDADKFEVLRIAMWKSTDFQRRIIASHKEAASLTLSCGCPHCGLLPIQDFTWWVWDSKPGKGDSAIGGARLVVGSRCGVKRTGAHDTSKLQA